jgi:hypothetical protein
MFHHELKGCASHQQCVELLEKGAEVHLRIPDDPVEFPLRPRDVPIQAHLHAIPNSSHSHLSDVRNPPGRDYPPPPPQNSREKFAPPARRLPHKPRFLQCPPNAALRNIFNGTPRREPLSTQHILATVVRCPSIQTTCRRRIAAAANVCTCAFPFWYASRTPRRIPLKKRPTPSSLILTAR